MSEGIEKLLGKIEFSKIPDYGADYAVAAGAARRITLGGKGPRINSIRIRSATRGPKPEEAPEEKPVKEDEFFIGSLELAKPENDAADSFGAKLGDISDSPHTTKGVEPTFRSTLPRDQYGSSNMRGFSAVVKGGIEQPKKPDEIIALENVLSEAYNTNVRIGYVRDIPQTRKQVKEVRFRKPDDPWLYKAWIFKADPVMTKREMTIYYIASQNNVPTGRPIGFKPDTNSKLYPFDVAILGGGIVEHAGDSYDALIKYMKYEPRDIHETSIAIARMVADTHAKFTAAKNQFEQYGVSLDRASPSMELRTRMLAALRLNESDSSRKLLDACEALYKRQSSLNVISHGDLHTGNIVTRAKMDADHTSDFGIIDFGSVMMDTWLGDLYDFFIHHKRKAIAACGSYDFPVSDLENAYVDQFGITSRMLNLGVRCSLDRRDSAIQSCLWNLYEMFDPTRKDQADILQKATYHASEIANDFAVLTKLGLGADAQAISGSLTKFLDKAGYRNIIPGYSSRRSIFDILRRH
jgi:thiamine kinase-like enzyme